MLKEPSISESSLSISYVINSSLEQVYSAWTEKKEIVLWMGGSNVRINNVEADLKVDGKFEIEMESPDGVFIAYGEYRAIESDKLIFSWCWKESMVDESLMTVKFSPTADGTLIDLTHEQLPSKQAVGYHMEGWISSFKKLEKYLIDA
ncbi:MAG: hypothetical protein DRQ88_00880 [Epsilonproteobacteria bacterium]|nr:MAG: hypothetical protein DRQ89_11065 [Campylobacterota bacterium]RLA68188.1 MAG: hypothetical protein DRQ88_00880 [Campylobacterota bacterium]